MRADRPDREAGARLVTAAERLSFLLSLLTTPAPTSRIGPLNATSSDQEEDDMRDTRPALLVTAGLAAAIAASPRPPWARRCAPRRPTRSRTTPGSRSYPGSIASMDVSGDSISKAFNGRGRFPCANQDQEQFNWATSDTNGVSFCARGGEGVYSQAERIECARGSVINRAVPNHAASGAQMLDDFADAGRGHPPVPVGAARAPLRARAAGAQRRVRRARCSSTWRAATRQRPGSRTTTAGPRPRPSSGSCARAGHPHHHPRNAHRRGRDGPRVPALQPRRQAELPAVHKLQQLLDGGRLHRLDLRHPTTASAAR